MTPLSVILRFRRCAGITRAALAAATLLLFGCSGGVGTGGTGASYVAGSVDGFGSIFVGGVEFDDRPAVLTDDDGARLAAGSLRLGMTVEVEGTPLVAGADGRTATAHAIRLATAVTGPVESVDLHTPRLTVLGQRIEIGAATVIDAELSGGLAALRPGMMVTAYADPDAMSGRYLATRIELTSGTQPYRLRGVVRALDPAGRTLRIGDALLDYSRTPGVPADLADGQLVRARLRAGSLAGPLVVEALAGASAAPAEAETAIVEGTAAAVAAGPVLRVGGVRIDGRSASISPSPAALVNGAHVYVEGLMRQGTLVAGTVRVIDRAELGARTYHLNGPITSLDRIAATFVLRTTRVDYSGATFVNGAAAQLADGVALRVTGRLAADGKTITATRVVFQ